MINKEAVIIVNPPLANIAYPALGPSLLTVACDNQGIPSSVYYANLRLAARIGADLYRAISLFSATDLIGEALFCEWGLKPSPDISEAQKTVTQILNNADGRFVHEHTLSPEMLFAVFPEIEPTIDECVQEILARQPKIVGFSSVFQQTMSSMALARRIKALDPSITLVIGGGNVAAPMGDALAALNDVFDFVFSGEADFDFPKFCRQYLDTGHLPNTRVIECDTVADMDQVSCPNYDDYVAQATMFIDNGRLPADLMQGVMFETSRGCWYGAKNHCKFCGLNGLEIGYRRKSADRILAEIDTLQTRYTPKLLQAADNIMPHEFRRDVLPVLAQRDEPISLFYEVKSNLRQSDLDQFAQAGVTKIQPGIESLSSQTLKLMAKGVTAIRNLCTLRDCASNRIYAAWNILYGFPGERKSDYEATLAIMPYLEHLQPPEGIGPIRIDRYSPYFNDHQRYGIENLQPLPAYRHIYPAHTNLNALAYAFIGDYTTELLSDPEFLGCFRAAVAQWKAQWSKDQTAPLLQQMDLGNGMLLIHDTRRCAKQTYLVLSESCSNLLAKLEAPVRCSKFDQSQETDLQILLNNHYVIAYEGYYVSLVLDTARTLRQTQAALPKQVVEPELPLFELATA
ncbi:MAG: RiPP maturation radical SAM C-methyltransferase [Chloroflexota bacterium]